MTAASGARSGSGECTPEAAVTAPAPACGRLDASRSTSRAQRNPMLSFLLSGWFLLRTDAGRFVELLFHEPPRRLDRTPLSIIQESRYRRASAFIGGCRGPTPPEPPQPYKAKGLKRTPPSLTFAFCLLPFAFCLGVFSFPLLFPPSRVIVRTYPVSRRRGCVGWLRRQGNKISSAHAGETEYGPT